MSAVSAVGTYHWPDEDELLLSQALPDPELLRLEQAGQALAIAFCIASAILIAGTAIIAVLS
ncbi:hypothetical protein [uncultured Novosphingobium sp.]|uniref:hypothetical protein n=1 Tax=uncultured Novosphingobium sp. TaxID=292277 RepID=UPI003748DBE5